MGSVRMPGRRWLILAALFFARAATGFQFQSVGSSARMLMQDLGIDYSQLGMLLGAYLLPGIVVAFPAGLLGRSFRDDRLGLDAETIKRMMGHWQIFLSGLIAEPELVRRLTTSLDSTW